MDISKVISISGFPGLYKVLAQSKNGFIVESLIDKKRIPAYSHYKISSLEDISIYTTGEDKPIKDVLKNIFDKQNGAAAPDHKEADEVIKKYFETVLPEYDKERVRISDIKKVIQWYNILQKTELLTAPEPTDTGDKKDIADGIANEDAPKKTVKSNKPAQAKPIKTAAPKVKAAGVRKTGTA